MWSVRVAVVVVLVGLGVVLGPALLHVDDHFLGYETVDHYGTQWFYWFAAFHLQNGQSPAHTDLFFYPWGKDIYGHTGANLLDAWFAVPFRLLLGPVLGYNVPVLIGLGATAWAFARLIRRHLDPSAPHAWILGVGTLLFLTSPYVLYELIEGRPTQAVLLFPVLFLHALGDTADDDPRVAGRAAWFAGLWLALSGYQYWYYALFGGLLAIGNAAARMASHGLAPGPSWRIFRLHLQIALIAVLLCLPGALPLLVATLEDGSVYGLLKVGDWSLTSAPLITEEGVRIGMFLWQPFSGAAGFLIQDEDDGEERFVNSLYPTPLILLPALLLWFRRPGSLARAPLIVMLVLAALIAAGPVLVIAGSWVLPNPVYTGLALALRFVRRLWWPGRMLGFATILLYLPAALALRQLSPRLLPVAAVGALVYQLGVLSWAALVPVPVWDAKIPAGYRCLASGPPGAVLELPYAWTQAHLYYQTSHQRPIFGGMIEDNSVFAPEEFTTLRTTNPFVLRLTELAHRDDDVSAWTQADRDEVVKLGYRYILLQKDAFAVATDASAAHVAVMTSRRRSASREFNKILGMPLFEDARVAIWGLDGAPAPCTMPKAELDTAMVMSPNNDPVARVRTDPQKSLIQWVFPP